MIVAGLLGDFGIVGIIFICYSLVWFFIVLIEPVAIFSPLVPQTIDSHLAQPLSKCSPGLTEAYFAELNPHQGSRGPFFKVLSNFRTFQIVCVQFTCNYTSLAHQWTDLNTE